MKKFLFSLLLLPLLAFAQDIELELFGCTCCGFALSSCSTVPITDRKQLTIFPEYKINAQARNAYEQFKSKAKLITSGKQLNEVRNVPNNRVDERERHQYRPSSLRGA